MDFDEWFKQTSDYSYIGPEAEESERAWNYQQVKIDAVLKTLEDNFQYLEGNEPALTLMDDIKELLK